MASIGPSCMYKMRKIVNINNPTVPDVLYQMTNIHTKFSSEKGSDHVSTQSSNEGGIIAQQNFEMSSEVSSLINRQQKILSQLDELREQMLMLKNNLSADIIDEPQSTSEILKIPEIIINASPAYPPYSLLLVKNLCKNVCHFKLIHHVHSSVTTFGNIKEFSQAFGSCPTNSIPQVTIRLIWKNIGPNTELLVSETPIIGEVNILRYLARIIPNILKYDTLENYYDVDHILDICYSFIISKASSSHTKLLETLSDKIGKSSWICGMKTSTIADLAAFSVLKQIGISDSSKAPPNVLNWFKRCESIAI